MFANAETKIPCFREVPLLQLVFLDFQTSLENFLGFGAANGDMDSDLFVTTDTERSDGVAGFACHMTKDRYQYTTIHSCFRSQTT